MEEAPDYVEHEPQNISPRIHEVFKIAFRGANVYAKLVDRIQMDTLSFASLTAEEYFNKTYYVIKGTFSNRSQKGYLKYIFSILLFDFGFTIMSDKTHTMPGSMSFWKKIKLHENTECRIINVDTRYSRKYGDQPDDAIWGLNELYFIDGKINDFIVEGLYKKKAICTVLYDFILLNSEKLLNRQNIRLVTKSIMTEE